MIMDEDVSKKLLGRRIKQLRKSKNLTQFALGERIDIDQRQIAYIEGGNCFPSLKTLSKFADFFNCSLKDLFDFEYIETNPNLRSNLIKEIENLNDKELSFYHDLLKIVKNHFLP